MRYLSWIIALLLLTLFFNQWLQHQHNPNQQLVHSADPDSPVILQQNRQGHYVATGLINQQPVTFLLDTGATSVSVPLAIADRLELPRQGQQLTNTANGRITVFTSTLDKVQLGHLHLANVRATINPHMHSDTVLLGMSFLRQLDIQQVDGQLRLTLPHAQ